jgi:uncharacterized membrane protein YgcG
VATDPLTQPHPAQPATPSAGGKRRSRLRERSLLTNPVPVVTATLAAFTLAFGGLTVRLMTGHDPALGTLTSVSQVAARGGATTVTTRASGAAATSASSAPGAHSTTAPLVTSTSGSAATGGASNRNGDA